MTSAKSFFEPVLYRRDLRKTAPLWVCYLIFWQFILTLPILNLDVSSYHSVTYQLQRTVLDSLLISCVLASVYGLAAAWLVFGGLFRASTACFDASLPVRRESQFLTHYLSGLTVGFGPMLFAALCALAATAVKGHAQPYACLQFLFYSCCAFLFFFSFAALLCTIVGQMAAMPVIYAILNFTVYGVWLTVLCLMTSFVYGMTDMTDERFVRPFSPIIHLMSGEVDLTTVHEIAADGSQYPTRVELTGQSYLVALALVGLVFAGIALLLYRKHETERSGDVIAVKRLKPVFLYCFSVGCGLVIGVLLTALAGIEASFPVTLLCTLLGAFLGYFAARMMMAKSLHVFSGRKTWLGYGAVALLFLVLFGAMRLDAFGFEKRIPDPKDVAAVRVQRGRYDEYGACADPQIIEQTVALHRAILENREEEKRLTSDRTYSAASNILLAYELKNGRTIEREYTVCYSSDESSCSEVYRQAGALYNSGAMIALRWALNNGISEENFSHAYIQGPIKDSPQDVFTYWMDAQEALEFYQTCVLPDLQDGTMGSSGFVIPDWADDPEKESAERYGSADVEAAIPSPSYFFELQTTEGSIRLDIPEEAVRTRAYISSQIDE